MDIEPISGVNPYIVGVPVPPEQFFGYRSQLRQIYRVLTGSVIQPVRVLGLRRSGKTSLLRYLSSGYKKDDFAYATKTRSLTFIFVDLQQVHSATQFYSYIIREIWERIPHNTIRPPDEISNGFLFQSWINKFIKAIDGLNLVILLDEFDQLALRDEFDVDFFGMLRSIASTSDFASRFTWVTASVQDLHALSLKKGETDKMSPFWNIFVPNPVILSGFDYVEASELIHEPALSQNIVFTKREINEIYRISGRLPYFIQAVASEWFQAKWMGKPLKEASQQVITRLMNLEQIQRLLIGYWKRMTEDQQILLNNLANQKQPCSAPSQGISRPLDYGLIEVDKKTGLRIAGELFRQFIVTQQPRIGDYLNGDGVEVGYNQPEDTESSGGLSNQKIEITIFGDDNKLSISDISNSNFDEAFGKILHKADQIPDVNTKRQVEEALKGLRDEASKGDKFDNKKVRNWLIFLAKMAPDIFDVVVATISNPILGLGTAFKKIAEQAKKQK